MRLQIICCIHVQVCCGLIQHFVTKTRFQKDTSLSLAVLELEFFSVTHFYVYVQSCNNDNNNVTTKVSSASSVRGNVLNSK